MGRPRKRGPKKGSKEPESSGFCTKLKEAGCFDEFKLKVQAGIAVEEVARWLQEDMLQETQIKRESLARKVFRFKTTLPPSVLVTDPPLYVKRAIEKMKRGVDELTELEHLYLLQLRRISIDAETESRINKLFASTSKEIDTAARLLELMMTKKMELGITPKAPDQLNVTGTLGTMSLLGEDVDEQTKARVGLLAGKMLQAMEKSMEESKPVEASEKGEDDD